MAGKNTNKKTPWANGHYISKANAAQSLVIEGEHGIMNGFKDGDELAKLSWSYGDFGEAAPSVVEATGKTVYNWMMEAFGGMAKLKGVLSDDGKMVTFINLANEVDTYQFLNDEEFAAFLDSFDPASAPPSHYTPQPGKLGKFIFLSGAPGLGKSTAALLLSQKAGYVYYEGDCFVAGTNPYLPPDTKEPSIQAQKQRPLKGIPQDRTDACQAGAKDFIAMMQGQDYNLGPIKDFYAAMCKDLAQERKRLGGDWVVAQAVPFRSLRDHMREELGPDVVFMVLNMTKEDQKKRLAARHGESKNDGGFDANDFLAKVYDLFEPATKDEPNAIDIEVTADMSREDVVEKILNMINM